jgi:mono/diheme cytochrome c family protein
MAALWTTTACRSVRRGEPIAGPLNVSDPAVERGRLAFAEHCYKCHPGGEGGLGPSLNDKPLPRFLMKAQVRLGLGVMPSFNKKTIPTPELDDLMKYVLALRRHTENLQ